MKTEVIEIDGIIIFVHEIEEPKEQLLLEAKVIGAPLTGPYSYKKHQPHNPTGEYHLHVYKKENEIFSINKDGSGHDGYSGTRIPNKAFNALKDKFPDWSWPENQIIESLTHKIIYTNMRDNLRKVRVGRHRIDAQNRDSFEGYFHTFADDPFLTGGDGGWINRTVAIVEDENGSVRKVPMDSIRFLNEENE